MNKLGDRRALDVLLGLHRQALAGCARWHGRQPGLIEDGTGKKMNR